MPDPRQSHVGSTVAERLGALALALGASGLLGAAAWLKPAAEGIGTHRQFGLPSCGWIASFGTPCPSCGMTTSFALAADGRMWDSFLAQPMGFALALATAALAILGFLQAATGWPLGAAVARAGGAWVWWSAGGLAAGAWLWKIACTRGWLA